MRAVVQRVQSASVTVVTSGDNAGELVGSIGQGLCVLVGVTHDDGPDNARKLAEKVWNIFSLACGSFLPSNPFLPAVYHYLVSVTDNFPEGEDLQGAVQMVPPERLASLRQREGATRLSPELLAERLLELMRRPESTEFTAEGGQFSLAGAQPKKALYLVKGRWYEPRGRTPSTHILKPPIPNLPGQVENEAFCLRLAPRLDLPAPPIWVERFGELPVVVIERYDRIRMDGKRRLAIDQAGGEVRRVHQEDCCQALKVMPQTKYQNEGGPGINDIMILLSGSSKPSEDRDRFMRAQAYNFVIGGTDAHGRGRPGIHA